MKRNTNAFKTECAAFLRRYGIVTLRPLARYFGVESPTKKVKGELVDEIVSILCGEKQAVERTSLGAPVKNDFFDPEIVQKIEEIRARYASTDETKKPTSKGLDAYRTGEEVKNTLFVANSASEYADKTSGKPVYIGQLETVNGVSSLFGLDGKPLQEKVVVTVEQIRFYDFRDGDVVVCHAERKFGVLVLSEVLKLNGAPYKKSVRAKFETLKGVYPTDRVCFGGTHLTTSEKYFEWFLPLGKGQRGLISSPLKSGKTSLLKDLCKSLLKIDDLEVFALLIDQSPESADEFARILPKENFVCTSFAETDEEHVFAADFLLKRAKRLAEMGKDVFLLVDSLSSLAKCYDGAFAPQEAKPVGGYASKTLRYLKTYFGCARNFEQGGSLAIVCTLSTAADPVSSALYAEFSSAANMVVTLDANLAARRVFPAISLTDSKTERSDLLFDEETTERERFFRCHYLPVFGEERLHKLVEDSETIYELYARALDDLGKN